MNDRIYIRDLTNKFQNRFFIYWKHCNLFDPQSTFPTFVDLAIFVSSSQLSQIFILWEGTWACSEWTEIVWVKIQICSSQNFKIIKIIDYLVLWKGFMRNDCLLIKENSSDCNSDWLSAFFEHIVQLKRPISSLHGLKSFYEHDFCKFAQNFEANTLFLQ